MSGKNGESIESSFQKCKQDLSCAYCMKARGANLRCAACRNAYYCSKECQRHHWKTHKPWCLTYQKNREDLKREFRLLLQWRDKVKITMLQPLLLRTFTEELLFAQPATHALVINVKFHYSWRTFIMSDVPKAVPVGDLPGIDWDGMNAETEHMTQQRGFLHYVLLKTIINREPFISIVRPGVTLEQVQGRTGLPPVESIVDFFLNKNRHEFVLQSKLFNAEWERRKQGNLFKQWDVVRRTSAFSNFMINLLRLGSASPMHKTHVAVIVFDYGTGLGEIKELCKFTVITLMHAKALCGHRMSDEEVERMFDLENSPEIEEMRLPNSIFHPALTPVLLAEFPYDESGPSLSPHHVAIVIPQTIGLAGDDDRGTTPVEVCDEMADRLFEEVKRIPLPPIESPSIN
jgi:hypothetical protein